MEAECICHVLLVCVLQVVGAMLHEDLGGLDSRTCGPPDDVDIRSRKSTDGKQHAVKSIICNYFRCKLWLQLNVIRCHKSRQAQLTTA